MRDLDAMVHTGLYINDLSMHDFSRDMVLAGQQQSAELKLALDQVMQEKTKSLYLNYCFIIGKPTIFFLIF